jgi:transcription-repair coupling factor (superfamily II helicase)
MDLSALLPLVESALPPLPSTPRATDLGIHEAAKAATLAALAQSQTAPVLVVVPRPDRAASLVDELQAWLGDEALVDLFPEQDLIPYERVAGDTFATEQRLEVLRRLKSPAAPRVVVTSGIALAQTTIAPAAFAGATETLTPGKKLSLQPFLASLQERGYEMGPLVEQPGQASRRGGIVDVYPPASRPVRIELLGETIDSLRSFDPATQRSLTRMDEVQIGPAREAVDGAGQIADLRSNIDLSGLSRELQSQFEEELERLEEGDSEAGSGFWLPFLTSSTLLEHLPAESLVVVDEPAELRQALADMDAEAAETREVLTDQGRIPRNLPLPHIDHVSLLTALEEKTRINLLRWGAGNAEGTLTAPFEAAGAFGGRLRNLSQETVARMRAGWRVVIVSQQSSRLAELFESEGLDASAPLNGIPPAGSLRLVTGPLTQGWSIRLPDIELLLLTDSEIFGFSKQRRAVRRAATGREAFLADLTPGDYVVHTEHGIGRFGGLITRSVDNSEREFLELQYAEGDRLYVPSEHVDRVSRYIGPSEHTPALTRLSTQEWARAKERVRHAVTDLAEELLTVYAQREALPGYAFTSDNPWQRELEAAFPYVETPDQLRALAEIKRDMESPRPMDRVVVGDVGYGKTELALRAAFKAVLDGTQVAVLVPTTVLAQQHLQTFRERLGAFPTRIEVLSRFRSDAEQKQVIEQLAEGTIDIVIGTHRLLQKDVQFKNLGLLIIDEEQRFGVAHKERFKKLRSHVDVLTLSATPIPRTLHMTLSGIRDMSTIQSAPEERLPIATYVAEWDDRLVREAILRERDRGGQVYLVHNRVQNIGEIAAQVRKLVPEAEVAIGHGQMPEDQLERVMLEFARGDHDVLVCTTIIESGLDIPNVNTIIINQADRLGLAQLYQLRGRVGRGANRAFAYLLYDRNRAITEVAQKRLQAIFEASELGAGFQIALRDLEIRGAGNLLGTEQSGQIGAVGYDLYSRMLEDAVRRLRAIERGETPPPPATQASVTVDLPVPARIPESYIADLNLRLAVYQRLAALQTDSDASDLLQELADRFGPPPPSVQGLMNIVRLRLLARTAGIVSVLAEDDQIVVRSGGPLPARERLQIDAGRDVQVGTAQIRIPLRGRPDEWLARVTAIVERVAGLIRKAA